MAGPPSPRLLAFMKEVAAEQPVVELNRIVREPLPVSEDARVKLTSNRRLRVPLMTGTPTGPIFRDISFDVHTDFVVAICGRQLGLASVFRKEHETGRKFSRSGRAWCSESESRMPTFSG